MQKLEQMRTIAGKVVDDKLYFSEMQFNGLFCLDLKTYKCSFVTMFLNVPLNNKMSHRKCVQFGDWLYFLPERINLIHAYNPGTGRQVCFDLQQTGVEGPYIYEPVIWKDKLYYFSMKSGSATCVLNLKRHVLEKYDRFGQWCSRMGVAEELGCRLGQQDEKVYFVENKKNRIICWNLETEEGEFIESCAKQLFGVTCAENAIWMYTQDEPNLYCRDNNGNERLYEGKLIYRGEAVYNHVVYVDRSVVCVPKQGKELYVYHQEESSFQIIDVLEGVHINIKDEVRFFGYDVDGTVLYLFFAVGQGLIKYDTATKQTEWIPTTLSDEREFRRLDASRLRENWKRDGIVYEGGNRLLSNFLLMSGTQSEEAKEDSVGKLIYEQIVKKECALL